MTEDQDRGTDGTMNDARIGGGLRRLPQMFGRLISRGTYRPEIDGLRFVAIAFVLFGHLVERVARGIAGGRPLSWHERLFVDLMPAAGTGVFLFFGISAYILAAQFRRQRARGQAFHYRTYMGRRLQRIVPPYAIVLVMTLLVALAGYRPELVSDKPSNGEPLWLSFVTCLFYVHGLLFGMLPRLFPPGWSLEPEVHFYILAPLLFAALFGRDGRQRGGAALIATMIVIVAANVAHMALRQSGLFYYSLAHFLPFFMVGILAAEWFPERLPAAGNEARWDALGFVSLFLLAATGTGENFFGRMPASAILDPLRAVAILGILGGAVRGRHFTALLSLRWIAFVGGAAYSIYLTHLQVMQVLTALIVHALHPHSLGGLLAIAAALEAIPLLAVGLGFYIVVERVFMRPDIFSRRVPS